MNPEAWQKESGGSEGHPPVGELVLALDNELGPKELARVEEHLASCGSCRQAFRELGGVSVRLESLVATVAVPAKQDETRARECLVKALREQREAHEANTRNAASLRARRVGRWLWPMGLAASIVLAILMIPHGGTRSRSGTPASASATTSVSTGTPRTFEALGETFVALPYSNAELPMTAHIVQMRVPVASLNQAGVVVEPISLEAAHPNQTILADVLLGLDGEPLGVHVIDD